MNACGGGSVIGAAAVDKEADMVDEPFGGSSTEVASCETELPTLKIGPQHLSFLPVAGARNSQFLGVKTGNFSGGTGNFASCQ